MSITPLEIRKMEFRKKFRGYDPEEVINYLETIADNYGELIRENMALKEQLRELEKVIEDYRNLEATLQKTMTSAQKSVEQVKKNSEQEAELIIQNAQLQAENIISNARNSVVEITNEISALNTHKATLKAQLMGFLEAQLKSLENGDMNVKKVDIEDTFPHLKRKIKSKTPSLDNLFEE
ncbi:MAG: hypothetical protein APR63_08215 [Desulfuromonas sp. SDB]|nr:MAG: hypothetical protein APR63_08215 [Desulfuromonas sp. SDB]